MISSGWAGRDDDTSRSTYDTEKSVRASEMASIRALRSSRNLSLSDLKGSVGEADANQSATTDRTSATKESDVLEVRQQPTATEKPVDGDITAGGKQEAALCRPRRGSVRQLVKKWERESSRGKDAQTMVAPSYRRARQGESTGSGDKASATKLKHKEQWKQWRVGAREGALGVVVVLLGCMLAGNMIAGLSGDHVGGDFSLAIPLLGLLILLLR